MTILPDGIAGAIHQYQNGPSAEIVILESRDDPETLFAKLESLSEHCDVGTRVVVIGLDNDVMLYRELVRRGISDYVPSVSDPRAIVETLSRLLEDPEVAKLGRQISFIGAGGGVGSSTVAHNVAWFLGETFAEDVALLDLDLSFGTVALDFDAEAPQDIASVMGQRDRLDDQLLERFMAKRADHLFLLTAPNALGDSGDIDIAALDPLLALVRQNAPYAVLDLPCNWTQWTRHLLSHSDEIVVTARPTLASLRDAKNLVELLAPSRVGDSPIYLVINGTGNHAKSEIGAKDFENNIEAEVLEEIASDPALFGEAISASKIVSEMNKKHKISEQFRTLAQRVSGRQMLETAAAKSKGGLLSAFRRSR